MPVLAFGDESATPDLVVYALAIFRPEPADEARTLLSAVKRPLEISGETRLHARLMFSHRQRKGTPWQGVKPKQIEDMVRRLVEGLRLIGNQPIVAAIAPKDITQLPTAPGHPDRTPVGRKEVGAWAANVAIGSAAMIYGVDAVRFMVDGDETSIPWGLEARRADDTFGPFIDLGRGIEPPKVRPEAQTGKQKDPLLEVADLYAYIARRVLERNRGALFSDLYKLMDPAVQRLGPIAPTEWHSGSR